MARIILTICGAVLAIGLSQGASYAQQAGRSDKKAAEAQGERATPPSAQNAEREAEGREKATENERNERDLAAQEAMAIAATSQLGEVRLQTWLIGLSVALGGIASIVSVIALLVAVGTGRKQLRAYLVAEPRGIVDLPSGQHQALVILKNTGQTPAYEIESVSSSWVRPIEDGSFAPKPDDLDAAPRKSDQSIGPGREIQIFGTFGPLTDTDAKAVRDEERAVFVYGVVRYRDTFGHRQCLTYCHFYRGKVLDDRAAKFWHVGNQSS